MIRGFAKDAIVVLQSYDDYDRSTFYKNKVRKALETLKQYLNANDISMCYFSTDDVARLGSVITPDKWLSTLNRADTFFAAKHCEGMKNIIEDAVQYEEIYQQCRERFEITRDMSVERRFEVTSKKEAMARRLILKEFKLVIVFGKSKSATVRYIPRSGSGVMFMSVDSATFDVKIYMSDTLMDNIEILGVNNANMPLYEWEVDEGGSV